MKVPKTHVWSEKLTSSSGFAMLFYWWWKFNCLQAKGLGYAMNTSEELNFVKEVAEATGVVLDPVYRYLFDPHCILLFWIHSNYGVFFLPQTKGHLLCITRTSSSQTWLFPQTKGHSLCITRISFHFLWIFTLYPLSGLINNFLMYGFVIVNSFILFPLSIFNGWTKVCKLCWFLWGQIVI